MARRATIIKDLEKEGKELLILDAGNLFFKGKGSPSSTDKSKAILIAGAYHRMGYHAVNIGSDDLSAGIEFLRELQSEVHLPLLSANLLDEKAGKPIFKSHVIVDTGGIRVGVFGLTSDVRQEKGVTPGGYVISNPIAAAKRVVAEIGKDCDIIVALSNQGSLKEYAKLVQQVGEVQFIFGSGGRRAYHETIRSDRDWKAFLFQARSKGRHLGRIDLKVLNGARLSELERDTRLDITYNHTTITVNEVVKDDPEIKEWIGRSKRRQ